MAGRFQQAIRSWFEYQVRLVKNASILRKEYLLGGGPRLRLQLLNLLFSEEVGKGLNSGVVLYNLSNMRNNPAYQVTSIGN